MAAAQHSASSSSGGTDTLAEFERRLYTAGCPPVDLLVRTSGETRLSDFLLWQSRHALLVFTRVLWPQFGFLDLAAAVLQYQRQYPHLQRLQALASSQAAAAAVTAAEAAARQQQQLPPIKLAAEQRRRRGSPCSIASPASPSSRSSRSEGSEDAAAAAAAKAAAVEQSLARRSASSEPRLSAAVS